MNREIRALDAQLKRLYEENDYPSEQLPKNPNALAGFVREFNARFGCAFEGSDVLGELERLRKDKASTGGLPRLGRSYTGPKFLA